MATILNRQVTFSTNGTVTAAGLHNLIDETEIYAGIITTQPVITSVGSSDQLLIADADLTPTSAPRRVTVGSMFNDALNNGIYTSSSFTGTLTAGSFVGPLNGSVNGTIVSTAGTIAGFNSTTGTIVGLNSTTGTIVTGTVSTLNSTTGTIATLNSTTGTIGNLSTTLAGDLTISQGTATLSTTGATAATYGTTSEIPVLTIDAKGRVTSASSVTNPVGFRNRLINGDMRIDQRSGGTAYAITSSLYGSCDRWGSLAGANGVWTQQRVATALTDFPFAMRVQRTAGSTSTATVYVGQVIETTNCADLAGKSVTLSFEAIAGANFSSSGSVITCQVYTGTGSDQGWASLNSGGWSGGVASISASQAITTTKTRYSFTGSIPAGTNEIVVRFDASGTGTAGASDFFEITGVQLEAGSTATDFERRPISTELALCQRYYFKAQPTLNNRYGISRNISTTLSSLTVPFPIPMRTRPTALEQSGTANHYGVAYLATSAACSAVPTFAYSTDIVAQVQFTNTAVLTAGQASEGYSANASGYLAWSAEL